MNNKITFPELIELVAKKAGTSKRVSELFLKELFATVSQAMAEGDSVKIKGIGTFKMTRVNPRRSVNVNTGEEMEIPGHSKIAFAPDKAIADAVNQPFAQFETEVLGDDVTDEELAAIDSQPIIKNEPMSEHESNNTSENLEVNDNQDEADVQQVMDEVVSTAKPSATPSATPAETPASEDAATPPAHAEQPAVETPPAFVAPAAAVDSTEPVAQPAVPVEDSEQETPAQAETPQPAQEQEPEAPAETEPEEEEQPQPEAAEETTQPEQAEQEQPAEEVEQEQPAEEQPTDSDYVDDDEDEEDYRVAGEREKRKIMHRSLIEGFLVGVVTTIIVMMVSFRLYLMRDTATTAQPAKTEAAQPVAKAKPAAAKPAKPAAAPATDTVTKAAEPAPASGAPAASKVTYDTIKIGTTLNRMARKHYGKSDFWVYIYIENEAKIPNPNNVPVGTQLVIPPASKYGINKDDPASIAAAKKKQGELYNELFRKSKAGVATKATPKR